MNVLGHLNTTYLSSAYATTDNYGDVGNRIKDMVFEEEVHQSKTSEIFRVLLDGKKFILKVVSPAFSIEVRRLIRNSITEIGSIVTFMTVKPIPINAKAKHIANF